jgi:putative inorganic carbon (HCO3(-)) transporter
MRDLLILAIVVASVPFAIRHTWVAVMLWTWISVMNPHRLAFGFIQTAPIAAVAAGAALLSLVITRDRLRMEWTPPVIVLLLMVAWMCLTTVFAIDPLASASQLNKVMKIQIMTIVAVIALQSRKHIEVFIWIMVLSIGFYGFKGGIFTITTGGGSRVWGPPGGFIEDNNALAVAIIMVIPLINYLRIVATRRLVRLGLLALLLLCAISVLGSQSRGAFVAISAMTLVLWYRSERKVVNGVVIAIVATGMLALMSDAWEDRMRTIETYEKDSSALNRLGAWRFCFSVANHRPLGGGFDLYTPLNYALYAPEESVGTPVAHSIYFSMLGEHGYPGLFLFLLLWWLTFRAAAQIRRETRNRPEVAWAHALAGMCQVSMVGYLAGGAFLQLAYFDLPYNLMVIVVITQRWLRESVAQPAEGSATVAADPLLAAPLLHRPPT